MKKLLLVVDLEATCSQDGEVPREEMEIIEIGAVMADATTLNALGEFQTFVRPVRHPRLTAFCTQLTGIQQQDVESSPPYPQALQSFLQWAAELGEFVLCSWGDYDRKQFAQDCQHHGLAYPFGDEHLNLKSLFAERRGVRKMGLDRAIKDVGLKFSGTHHRGIDDARNIVRLLPFIFSPPS